MRYALGLDPWIDGILGLGPNYFPDYDEEHFLPALKNAGVIDVASVSFSISMEWMDETSFAVFGGVDEDKIVGGISGMYTFDNTENDLYVWALSGQGFFIDGIPAYLHEEPLPVVLDTGTTILMVPMDVFYSIS